MGCLSRPGHKPLVKGAQFPTELHSVGAGLGALVKPDRRFGGQERLVVPASCSQSPGRVDVITGRRGRTGGLGAAGH